MKADTVGDLTILSRLAEDLSQFLTAGCFASLIFITGDLGAGKTTFCRHLLRALGVPDDINIKSPTYTIIEEYHLPGGLAYHFDLFQFSASKPMREDLLEMMSEPKALRLVEWPDRLGDRFSADIDISLSFSEREDARRITIATK